MTDRNTNKQYIDFQHTLYSFLVILHPISSVMNESVFTHYYLTQVHWLGDVDYYVYNKKDIQIQGFLLN